MNLPLNYRILVIDDNAAIHRDFAKILGGAPGNDDLNAASAALFGAAASAKPNQRIYRIDYASQGEHGLELMKRAVRDGNPYALAFVDMRMPPGWDGVRTIQELWREHPSLHAVICTAYSDQALSDVSISLGSPDRLLILKKPFDGVEVQQLAASLCEKSRLEREIQKQIQELVKARASAEAADHAKSQFLANMSHEIRTPLTAILGYAEILREDDLPRELQVEHLDVICQGGNHLLHVLSDVLDVAKIEADCLEFEALEFSLAQSLHRAMAILRGKATGKGLEFGMTMDGEFPKIVIGDPTRLQQVLLNLIGNAVKFTAEGHVQVRAHGRKSDDHLVEIQIDIEDTGIGIPEHKVPDLFTVFSQADASMTRRFGGSGLGLVIARRLARAMGGDITVRSEPERGSCFTVSLTLSVPEGVAWNTGAAATALKADSRIGAAKGLPSVIGRVLIVDDAPDNRLLISRHLERAGARVVHASHGYEALATWRAAAASEEPFDLIVTDVQMPGLDGHGLTRALREQGCASPILVLTANALAKEREDLLAAGCDDYLTKPVNRTRFLATCAKLLAGTGRHAAADGASKGSSRPTA